MPLSPRTDARRPTGRLAGLLAIAAVTLALAGCQDSLARRDTISSQAGDAIAANRAIHVVDPWPAAAANTDIPANGPRAVRAIERYERGSGAEAPSGGAAQPGAMANAASPAGSAATPIVP